MVSYDFIVIYSYSEFYGWLVVLTILKYTHVYVGVVQNTFSRTALNRSANRVATAVPQ